MAKTLKKKTTGEPRTTKEAGAKAKPKASSTRKAKVSKASPRVPEVIEPEIVKDTGDEIGDEIDGILPPVDDEDFRKQLDDVVDIEIDPDKDILEELEKQTVSGQGTASNPEILDHAVDEGRIKPAAKRTSSRKKSESTALTTATDPVAIYLAEIRKYPLLTKEREQELARLYRETGDSKAAELLVTSNLRFVVKVAAEYSRFGAKLIDLVQEGNVGLMHAVREFNPYKGVRLITYAVWWIRGYIQEYLMRQYSLVRIGTTQNQRKLFYRLQKERDALSSPGHEPNVALLAGRLGVTEEEVETMTKRLSGRDISLNLPVDGENSTTSLLDFEQSMDPAVDVEIGRLEELEVLKDNLEKIRPTLSEKETYILTNRILSDEPMTLQEIGDHYKVTREAVRQLEARLIGKIRSAVTHSLDGDDETEE